MSSLSQYPLVSPKADAPTFQHVYDGAGRLLAVFVRSWGGPSAPYGVHFLTRPEDFLQLGWIRHPVGKLISAHSHPPAPRWVNATTEILFLRKGHLRITLFGDGYEYQTHEIVGGDIVILLAGGHGFEVLEEVEMWEVKQGPYLSGQDKLPCAGLASPQQTSLSERYTEGMYRPTAADLGLDEASRGADPL
jgi:hypothetical protein